MEPTCPNGCTGPVLPPTIVFVPGSVSETEQLRGNEVIPPGVPTNDPVVVTAPYVERKWNVSLTMRELPPISMPV